MEMFDSLHRHVRFEEGAACGSFLLRLASILFCTCVVDVRAARVMNVSDGLFVQRDTIHGIIAEDPSE